MRCVKKVFERTILVVLTFSSNAVGQSLVDTDMGTIYTCCPTINMLHEGSCKQSCTALDSLSEFDSHPDLWAVPKSFRPELSAFSLKLETKNKTSGFCSRIKGSFGRENDTRGSNKVFPSFFPNGSLVYKDRIYHPDEYCFDELSNDIDDGFILLDIAVTDSDCRRANKISSSATRLPYHEEWINQLFAAVSGLSCLFTIVNVIIYLSLRNYLNVSGWIEFAYFFALGVFSAFSIPAFLHQPTSYDETFCYIISVSLQFSEIMTASSYFLIAFDVYWMLRKSGAFGSYGEDVVESKLRLVVYYLLLLAIPVGVSAYGMVLNLKDKDHPMYGEKSCFAPAWPVTDYLIFGTESLTFLIILLSISHIFSRLSASTDVDDAPRVSLLSNMFFFTLSYWIMDLLKFVRPLYLDETSEKPPTLHTHWLWTALDGFTYAQGVLSFVVFIFNRKTLKAFRKKAGTDGTLRAIFRHACCGDGNRVSAPHYDAGDTGTPLSPLMKATSLKRSTVRRSHLY